MSPNADERRRTGEELTSDLALCGRTLQEAAADLEFTPERLLRLLDVGPGADPVDVWQTRDHLEQAASDAGARSVPFTVLTARACVMARAWYRLRPAPRHAFPVDGCA
ncbi:DUF2316 family protein [Streptomyces sp. SID8379]|uniref:DUF2316 family protein n=1 Tax=unclassified Streptomyces TaxID=2593676 RepID=UPI00037EB379|nr:MULTISPECIES: DUF2316 family protein [unclassified Streptomyces]MYW63127.1 DUF2316 family protein [Streptomyces sp. SID8379]